ncbi:MAG TPA: small ribosomal subunit Rsm22 family protein [Clostridia bacterium]|jgi:ribosomal protein RSM22 (predicted rRNA methylase)|nr:small ribosomal subunit Rsm22 family protein [Clostridia bacterium]HPZ51512.1 small ribosomal subunit Rsm22 family protein [Clostridia bacterium]
MNLPERLVDAIRREIEGYPLSEIAETARNVSNNYRGMKGFVSGEDEAKAYVAYRMPATFASLYYVFNKIVSKMPHFKPETLLDVGAGPATSVWASSLLFDSLTDFKLFEHEGSMIQVGKRMLEFLDGKYNIEWHGEDITRDVDFDKSDIVVSSYMLNEIDKDKRESLIKRLWESTKGVLVLVEPGSRLGFGIIDELRSLLVESGGKIIGPCTHNDTCPMPEEEWCHFAQRVNRPDFLRYAKGGTLPYEDEKFSYICVSKIEFESEREGVIVFPPKLRKGHVILDVCTKNGIEKRTYAKKEKEVYKAAKKLNLGDEI